MKKTFKKVVAAVTTAALAFVGTVTFNPADAKAADGDVTLHIKLTDDSAYTDWAANTWGGAVVDENATQINKPTGWGDGTLPQLAEDEAGWAKISVNISAGIGGWQWIKYNADGSLANQVDCWNSAIASLGLSDAYYDLASGKWYKEKELTNEIKMAEVADEFYLIGGGEYFGDWNLDNAVKLEKNGDTYSVTIHKMAAGDYAYKFLQDAPQYKWSYQAGLGTDNANVTLNLTELSDVTFSITVTERKGGEEYDKAAMTKFEIAEPIITKPAVLASEIEEAIEAIGEVTLDSKKAIEDAEALYAAASKAEQDKVSNYAVLTQAREAYDALVKAEEAAGYDVTVHFNNTPNWDGINMYGFYAVEEATVDLFGAWPGIAIKEDSANEGYYSAGFNLPEEAKEAGKIFVIFANGTGGSEKQTADVELTLTADKNEYWISLNGNDTVDGFKNTVFGAEAVTNAPEGWVESKVEEAEKPEEPADDGNEETGDEETGDEENQANAWDDAKLKIHFLNDKNWDVVAAYLTYGSWAGVGAWGESWPGAEMTLEKNSSTWYALGTSASAEDTYNVIFNNFVNDDDFHAGLADKIQTVDITGLEAGEYWFVLDAIDSDTEDDAATGDTPAHMIKYTVKMFTSVEELEAAGYTYDGEGIVIDEEDLGDGEDEGNKEEDNNSEEKEDPASGNTAGLPIAGAMVVAMLAASVVVASRKRKVA